MTRRQAFLLWIEASALLMLVGALGPWIKALGVSVSGTDGSNDGWFVVGAAVFAGVLAALTHRNRGAGLCALIGGVAGLAVSAYDRNNVQDKINSGGELLRNVATVGWGLNLCLAASISLGVAGVVWLFTIPSLADNSVISSDARDTDGPVEGNAELARAIEAGLVEYDPQRGVWTPTNQGR